MPDKWEYPWFAAWDLAFHCVALAHVDPAFAKYQLLLLCREWFQHPNGALPAYEWDFGDVNPPVQAWAALEVFAIDGARDFDFLSVVFDKLLVNFTWWVNREDADGSNLFEGGFLGLDNIGPLDRSHLPVGGTLEQSDATGWMAFYALSMAGIAAILNRSGQRPATDLVLKFLEHFAAIREAMDTSGVWDDDRRPLLRPAASRPTATVVPVKVRSMVGIIPLFAAVVLDEALLDRGPDRSASSSPACVDGARGPAGPVDQGLLRGEPGDRRLLLGVVGVEHLVEVLDQGCSTRPSSCRRTACGPSPPTTASTPTCSTSRACGRRSTTSRPSRRRRCSAATPTGAGPIWFPLNYLLISALDRYARFFGDDLQLEYPTGSGRTLTLDRDRRRPARPRSSTLFIRRRRRAAAVLRRRRAPAADPAWKDNLLFNEYFHGDNGAGLGASHQTGWTGLIADLIRGRPGDGVYAVGDLFRIVHPTKGS